MITILDLKKLYEIDDFLWLEKTVEQLKNKQLNELDLENLIEELDDLGNERKHRVESLLEQVIRHFLLYQYWESERDYNQAHWESEIVNFQNQLETYLTTSLHNHLAQNLSVIYLRALRYVRKKTQDTVDFPEQCPYTLNKLLKSDCE